VVSRFGQGLVKAAGWAKQWKGQPYIGITTSARGIYILLCNVSVFCYVIYYIVVHNLIYATYMLK
jgi:hypothetical protein